jgi:putative component of toxin-antitoxin plasmid stabilization module
LVVLKQKAMKREVVNKIKEFKAKQKEEKRLKRVQNAFTQVEQMVQRRI